jgi:hypothetical protein
MSLTPKLATAGVEKFTKALSNIYYEINLLCFGRERLLACDNNINRPAFSLQAATYFELLNDFR